MTPYVLVTGDFVTTGGMDRANHALAAFLAHRGDPLHLVAHRITDDLAALPNVRCHRVPKPAGSYTLGKPLLDRVGRWCAARILQRGGRVIVNGGNCQIGDVNWVHYVHAAYRPQIVGPVLRRLKRRWDHRTDLISERHALTRARLVIANSAQTRRHLIELLNVPEERVHVVYYGVDSQAFRPADSDRKNGIRKQFGWSLNRPLVLFIGALSDRRKGFDTLYAAWQTLCSTPAWQADLIVVGSGAELPSWRQRVADAGLANRIAFLGFRSDVPDILAACDLLVSPTRYEAYGLNVHEALCSGLPAIVSRAAGVAERYPQELDELLLDNPEDPGQLADRLRAWAGAPDRFRVAVDAFGARLRAHTWDHMAEQIVSLIEAAPTVTAGPPLRAPTHV